jgi:hypothetical protein
MDGARRRESNHMRRTMILITLALLSAPLAPAPKPRRGPARSAGHPAWPSPPSFSSRRSCRRRRSRGTTAPRCPGTARRREERARPDCPPMSPAHSQRRFTAEHAYRRAGVYTVRVTLMRSGKALAVATATVNVMAGRRRLHRRREADSPSAGIHSRREPPRSRGRTHRRDHHVEAAIGGLLRSAQHLGGAGRPPAAAAGAARRPRPAAAARARAHLRWAARRATRPLASSKAGSPPPAPSPAHPAGPASLPPLSIPVTAQRPEPRLHEPRRRWRRAAALALQCAP